MVELIESSLNQSNFSSNMKGVESPKIDENIIDKFEIPKRYFIDRVIILPIDLNTYFIYWEITKKLKDKMGVVDDKFIFKIYDNNNTLLTQFIATGEVGDYYLQNSFENFNLKIIMGVQSKSKNHKKFMKLIESKPIIPFMDKISLADKKSGIWLSKKLNSHKLIKSSIPNNLINFPDEFIKKQNKKEKILSSKELSS